MTAPASADQPAYGKADGRALASVAVQFFVNGAVFASFVPRLPEVRDRLDVSIDTIGLLITISLALGMLGSVTAGPAITRYGSRRVLIVGASVLVCAVPLIGFATVPAVFVLGYATMSIFDVIVDVAMNLQGSWLSARRHAPVMNRLHGLWSLGTVVGGIVASRAAAAGVSIQSHLVVVAIVLSASLVFVGRGLLREDEHVGELVPVPAGSGDTATDDVVVEPPRSPAGRINPGRLGLVLFAVTGGISITVELVSTDWAAFRLSEDFGASAGFAGLGYVAVTVGMTAGRFGGDWAVSRLGPDRLLRLAIVVSAIGLAGAGLAPNRWAVVAAYVVAGLGIATFFPRLYDDAAQHQGKRGAGLAWLTAGSRFTGFLVPGTIGVLAASRLSVGAATAIVTLPCVAAFFVLSLRRSPNS